MRHSEHSKHGVSAIGCQLRTNLVNQLAVLLDETTVNEQLSRSEQTTPEQQTIVVRFASLEPFWDNFTRDNVMFFPLR